MPYLIDGNNLLGSWGAGGRRGAESDARAEVVRRVAQFCRSRGARATIVFDGAPFRADRDRQSLGSVEVEFPGLGSDADSVIRARVDAARSPEDTIVVTSDKALYSYCRTRGARTLRAHEWNALARSATPHVRGDDGTALEKPTRVDDIEEWLVKFGGDSR